MTDDWQLGVPDTEITYHVEYRSQEYIGAPNEKTWYTADLKGFPTLPEALDLTEKLKAGYRLRGAGFITASETRIYQRVTMATLILTDNHEDGQKDDRT